MTTFNASSTFPHVNITHYPQHQQQHHHHQQQRNSLPNSTLHPATTPAYHDFSLYEPDIYNQALAQLQHPAVSATSAHPNISIDHTHSARQSPPTDTVSLRHDSAFADAGVAVHDWQFPMQVPFYNSMSGPATSFNKGVKRARSHQRTPSASTIASNGPASPYLHNSSYPHIANTDHAPNSPAFYADQALPQKNLPTPSHTPVDSQFSNVAYMPSQGAHVPSAHLAMKSFGLDHHNTDDFLPDFAPSRQSMSSYGTDSPATPQSGAGDVDTKQYSISQNGEMSLESDLDMPDCLLFAETDYRQPNPNVQLYRTESQAFQDELYNPNAVFTSAPTKPTSNLLSPPRNLISERLQTANLARSVSPGSGLSRDRSPFRDNSPLANDWRAPQGGPVGTAAGMRQQQKDAATQAEFAQHRATLRREPTKTISPKDALLDYNETDQAPLFQDNIPSGYEKHLGGTEQWQTNAFLSQPGPAYGELSTTGPQAMGFRTATADNGYSGTGFDFPNGLPQGHDHHIQSTPFQTNYQATVAAKMNNFSDHTPDFPATIPSMETSISDAGMPPSSQESNGNGYTSTPQRPDDTRANTGTYTCTYHGCTQRFESHANLQKHKRDYHRSQQQTREGTSTSGTGSASPRSTASPAPSGSGMTSAALLARNSQAGPHKCTRVNPSTGKPCNTIFSRPYDLTRHEDTIHNNRKHKVRCPMCREEKTFSRNDALTRHMRVVHPEVEAVGKRGRRD